MPFHLYKCVARFDSDSSVSCRFLKTENRLNEPGPGVANSIGTGAALP